MSWANDGIDCLNRMFEARELGDVSAGKMSSSQRSCVDRLARLYKDFPKPDDVCDGAAGALRELCGASSAYSADRADLAPYSKELVSWP